MQIVTAGMGNWAMRAERQAGRLLDRQRIQFGADHHGGSRAVSQHGDDAGAPDPLGDGESGIAGLLRHQLGGFDFVGRHFRVGMQAPIQRLQGGVVAIDRTA